MTTELLGQQGLLVEQFGVLGKALAGLGQSLPAVAQGATIKVSLVYYDDEGNGRKPSKLVLRIAPDAETKSFLKRNGAAYSVPDPSFRVNLK